MIRALGDTVRPEYYAGGSTQIVCALTPPAGSAILCLTKEETSCTTAEPVASSC
jgi:hypothetical protein